NFEINSWDVEFRRAPKRVLMARVYQPQGGGPFPVLLDLHGGAWNNQDRTANEMMDANLARSGVLVVAIDLTRAGEAPYPASVQDANYGVRWLKYKAREWNGAAETIGALGSSSGGHEIELCAMKPHDSYYNVHKLSEAPELDATLNYVATRSPVSNPYARFLNAEQLERHEMVQNSKTYFNPWDTIHDGNPQEILDRGESVTLVPLLIMQGELDDNVRPAVQEKFVASYRAAGGECEYEVFAGCEHLWIREPGPQTDRAYQTLKAFIARQLKALRLAA
ncbi:MAG TPA: alpha/beta hydrolase, partial [Candidatus Saccharimonadales bacterium]|nr:alpha/beta hydrolase [Candidatus Saccharimonadales bacterium]